MVKKLRPSFAQRLVQAFPKILLAAFLFVGMPWALAQAMCEPLPEQSLDRAMKNEAPPKAPTEVPKPSSDDDTNAKSK